MSATGKILGLFVLGGGAYALSQLLGQAKEQEKKPSLSIDKIHNPRLESFDFWLFVTVSIDNPTDKLLNLDRGIFTLHYKDKTIQRREEFIDMIQIKPGETRTFSRISLQIPTRDFDEFARALSKEKMPEFSMEVEFKEEAKEVSFKDKKDFEIK